MRESKLSNINNMNRNKDNVHHNNDVMNYNT